MKKIINTYTYITNYNNILTSIYLDNNRNNYLNFNFNFINEKNYIIPNNFKLPLKMNIKLT